MTIYSKGSHGWHIINSADSTPIVNHHGRPVLIAEDGSECSDLRKLTAPTDSFQICSLCASAVAHPAVKSGLRTLSRLKKNK
jgi:hypothetical protein